MTNPRALALVAGLGLGMLAPAAGRAQTPASAYSIAPTGIGCFALGPLLLRSLVDSATLGGAEVEVAELTLPAGWDSAGPGHRHGRVEVLYVLAGQLRHVVNDVGAVLDPGHVGVVRPGDRVRHQVLSTEPVRALVIWAPGGELERITGSGRASKTTCPPK